MFIDVGRLGFMFVMFQISILILIIFSIVMSILVRKRILKKLIENKTKAQQLIINILYFIIIIPSIFIVLLTIYLGIALFIMQ
jgi:hypothetical protein